MKTPIFTLSDYPVTVYHENGSSTEHRVHIEVCDGDIPEPYRSAMDLLHHLKESTLFLRECLEQGSFPRGLVDDAMSEVFSSEHLITSLYEGAP
jgi:hypothetical protein